MSGIVRTEHTADGLDHVAVPDIIPMHDHVPVAVVEHTHVPASGFHPTPPPPEPPPAGPRRDIVPLRREAMHQRVFTRVVTRAH